MLAARESNAHELVRPVNLWNARLGLMTVREAETAIPDVETLQFAGSSRRHKSQVSSLFAPHKQQVYESGYALCARFSLNSLIRDSKRAISASASFLVGGF